MSDLPPQDVNPHDITWTPAPGVRKGHVVSMMEAGTSSFSNIQVEAKTPKAKESRVLSDALETFFILRDRKYKELAKKLVMLYDFADLVDGIYKRYKVLPIGWKPEIEKRVRSGDRSFRHLSLRNITWFTEDTETFPNSIRVLRLPTRQGTDKLNIRIDEFLQSECKFLETLRVVMDTYVLQISAIADGKIGQTARQTLGLSNQQVRYMFDPVLRNLYREVKRFWIILEILVIVTKEPRLKDKGGRVGYLAQVINKCKNKLKVPYEKYSARYESIKKIIQVQSEFLKERKKENPNPARHLDFKELWTEVTKSKDVVSNQSLDSVLLQPLKRFTNYKLYFEAINKQTPDEHPAKEQVNEALQTVIKLATNVDDAVSEAKESEEIRFQDIMKTAPSI